MITYALDTNIISYLLKDDQAVIDQYHHAGKNGNDFVLPPIVYYEAKRWFLETGATDKSIAFDKLCDIMPLGELTQEILNTAASVYVKMRKAGKPMSDADIIIAAFCIVNDYTLVTNNTRHFERIDDLKLVNWKK
jgi:predicted nucleic acid-binding protein